ncbi:MAG: hypothetical protein CSA15_11575 [Candidatus Delongbacteria bacterium]|nr:MAG: hypothetical protein CSA15_11575 [Candidatus Delongbacteria bacterium]
MNKTIILLIALLLFSCSNKPYEITTVNGVKTIRNFKNDTVKEIKLSSEISNDSLSYAASFDFDRDGNLYILDRGNNNIVKFNSEGKYIKSFIKTGNGPGEVESIGFFSIANDRIVVIDRLKKRYLYYSLDGDFINSIESENFVAFSKLNSQGLLGLSYKIEKKDKRYLDISLIYDRKGFDSKSIFSTGMKVLDKNYVEFDNTPIFDLSDDIIAVYERSRDRFKVEVFDNKGERIYNFSNNFTKKKLSKKDIKSLKKRYPHFNLSSEYIFSGYGIVIDDLNRVWALMKFGDKFSLSCYKDGIFLFKTSLFDIKDFSMFDITEKLKVWNNKIYLADSNSGKVLVYDLE